MANDAFALSPMSASAALPSEADYEAISEAFMETSRGRWFLKEYARRNRNADTAMVLEAVARIEVAVAAQNEAAGQPDDSARLEEALAAFRTILEATQASTHAAIADLTRGDGFGPARKALRIIREVAWRLREVGYDGRICDILETQANAVDANLAPPLTVDLDQRIAAAFAEALSALEAIGRDEAPAEVRSNETAPPRMAENVVNLATLKPATSAGVAAEPAAPSSMVATGNVAGGSFPAEPSAEAAVLPTVEGSATPADEMQTAASAPIEMALDRPTMCASQDLTAAASDEATAAVDGALDVSAAEDLDLAALETAACALPAADEVSALSAAMIELEVTAHAADVETLARDLSADLAGETSMDEATTPEMKAMEGSSAETLSLGASLLARGMVGAPQPDPLAPLRRMSQAEKIAFFS
jgi:hypothetical protein